MSDLALLTAGFSAIFGTNIITQKSGGQYSINDIFGVTYSLMKPLGFVAQPVETEIHSINPAFSTIDLVNRLTGGGPGGVCSFSFDELDPGFDYDFSHVEDDGKTYMRGGFQYERPYGWKRIAIKVVGKYDDDTWLGPNGIRTEEAPGEWPVSYHGTNVKSAKMILIEGFRPGQRQLFGKGIYTSPSLEMVERLYAQEFTCEGKTYKIAFQNRVNPDQRNGHLQIIPASQTSAGADYWLSPGGTADVRPYGILIREVS